MVEALQRGLNKSESARLFGISLSSVKRYARLVREGCPLKPGKAPGKRPKIHERGRRLLQADLKKHRRLPSPRDAGSWSGLSE